MMVNFRVIARVFSLLLIFEGLFMLLSAGVSYIYQEDTTLSFLLSALITIITGILVFTPLRNEERIYGNKEGYIIVTGIWIIFSVFGTLPYLLSGSINNFPDAFFESMSGFSTTGATIVPDVESLPNGILFWRSLTQWIGGIGIIFISFSVLPVVRSINIQIAATEFSAQQTDKIHPRTKDSANRLITIYLLITLSEVFFLSIGGMPVFDAICHSLSTLSTGGFSTQNDGMASFSSPYIMLIMTLFMFVAGTNMTLIYFGLKGNFKKVITNNEFIFYIIVCVSFIIILSITMLFSTGHSSGNSFVNAAFHVVSIITTTGFYTQDFNLWSNLLIIMLFVLMFTGGMAGSTSGGVKMVRLLLLTKNNRKEVKSIIHPNAFVPVRLDRHIISQNTIYNLLVFFTLYFFVLCAATVMISFMGYDLITSFSTSASMLGNIGPGFGSFGPFTNYSELPVGGKYFLSGLMLIGRLEVLTVLILLTRNFYRH